MSLGESHHPETEEEPVILHMVEDLEVRDIEAVDQDGIRHFIDIYRIKKGKFGRFVSRVTVVNEFGQGFEEVPEATIPKVLKLRTGDVLNPTDKKSVPEGRKAIKIATIAGITGGLTLTALGAAKLILKKQEK